MIPTVQMFERSSEAWERSIPSPTTPLAVGGAKNTSTRVDPDPRVSDASEKKRRSWKQTMDECVELGRSDLRSMGPTPSKTEEDRRRHSCTRRESSTICGLICTWDGGRGRRVMWHRQKIRPRCSTRLRAIRTSSRNVFFSTHFNFCVSKAPIVTLL